MIYDFRLNSLPASKQTEEFIFHFQFSTFNFQLFPPAHEVKRVISQYHLSFHREAGIILVDKGIHPSFRPHGTVGRNVHARSFQMLQNRQGIIKFKNMKLFLHPFHRETGTQQIPQLLRRAVCQTAARGLPYLAQVMLTERTEYHATAIIQILRQLAKSSLRVGEPLERGSRNNKVIPAG